jgi:hypothetical protein
MASFLRPNSTCHPKSTLFTASPQQISRRHWCKVSLKAKKQGQSESIESSQSENAVLKVAWYGSELLGIAASFFRPGSSTETLDESTRDGTEVECCGRSQVVEAIKEDFERSDFVTGSRCIDPNIIGKNSLIF